jgi:MFS family permease
MAAGVVATIPLVIIGLVVRERKTSVKKQAVSLDALRGPFIGFLAVMLLFTLGNSSDAFIILRAENVGIPIALIPVVYAFFNLVSASTAIPAGKLADRIGRRRVIGYGWGVYALAYVGFALARSPWMIWVTYGFYGLFYSLTEGSAKAMVAELVSDENRGSAYGLYSTAVGVMALPASMIAGALWNKISPVAPFAFGAVLAAIAFIGLQMVSQQKPEG